MGPPVARAKKAAKAKNRKDDGVRVMAALLQLILFYRLCSIPSNKHVGAREFCDMRNCQVELRDGIHLSLSAAAFSDDSCQPRWCGAEVLNEDAAWKVKTCNSMMFALKAPYIWCKVLFSFVVWCVCVCAHAPRSSSQRLGLAAVFHLMSRLGHALINCNEP